MGDVLFIAERWKWAGCINYKVRYEEEGYMRKAAEQNTIVELNLYRDVKIRCVKKKKTATVTVP